MTRARSTASTTRVARTVAISVLVAMVSVATALLTASAPRAQFTAPNQSGSYITPFPPNDLYRLQIYGDWMGENLIAPLAEALGDEKRIQVIRKPRTLVPLVKPEHEDEVKAEEAATEPVQIAVMMFGISDRVNFRASPGAPPLRLGSEPWQTEYGRRVDRLLKALKKRAIAVYLIGQPPLRREDANTDAAMLSEILRDKAFVNGVKFIDINEQFVDENNEFTQFGPDHTGNRAKLRDGDGVSLTWAGNRKIAALIEKDIRRDLATALADRAVPLAGTEAEQRRITPDRPYRTSGADSAAPSSKGPVQPATAASQAAASVAAANRASAGVKDQSAENARITLRIPLGGGREEIITTEIIRPAISAAVLSLLNRTEVSKNAQQNYDTIAADLVDGTTLSLVVSPAATTAANGSKGQDSELYNLVWIRGDRLQPKPGRADDFRWPPTDDIPYTAPPAQTPATKAGFTKPELANEPAKSNIPRARLDPRG